MLSHTLCSCVCCNACRNTSTSSSEEDKTTLCTDSSRTVCDITSATSDAEALDLAELLTATDVEALDLAELLTATDVEEEQEEDDEYLSLQLFSFTPMRQSLYKILSKTKELQKQKSLSGILMMLCQLIIHFANIP